MQKGGENGIIEPIMTEFVRRQGKINLRRNSLLEILLKLEKKGWTSNEPALRSPILGARIICGNEHWATFSHYHHEDTIFYSNRGKSLMRYCPDSNILEVISSKPVQG